MSFTRNKKIGFVCLVLSLILLGFLFIVMSYSSFCECGFRERLYDLFSPVTGRGGIAILFVVLCLWISAVILIIEGRILKFVIAGLVLILSLLSSGLVISYIEGLTRSCPDFSRMIQADHVQYSLDSYRQEYGTYPETIDEFLKALRHIERGSLESFITQDVMYYRRFDGEYRFGVRLDCPGWFQGDVDPATAVYDVGPKR